MALYAQAVQSGIKFAGLAAGVETAETVAAYNAEYSSISSKLAASRSRSATERNISAVNQDRINSNTKIRQQQDEAEAHAKVSAALAGSTGASVEAVASQTETNAALATSASNKAAEQQIENLKAGVYNSSMGLQTNVQVPKSSIVGDLANAFSSFELSDLETSATLSEGTSDAGTLQV